MAKVKSKAKKQNPAAQTEAKEIALKLRSLKKEYKTGLNALKTEFKSKMKAIAASAFGKALADFEKETMKRIQAKAKLLRETAANFDKTFQSKFQAEAPKAKSTGKKATGKKRGRAAKKA